MTKNYTIYQLKKYDYLFFSYDYMKKKGFEISLDNYRKVYSNQIESVGTDIDILNHLYTKFQFTKPEGYKGHSLSVSDIVQIDDKYYYVDSYGFVEL